jgi:alanine racemase
MADMRATRAVIHLDRLRQNIKKVKERLARRGSGVAICLPVKADAYGHGALQVARTALRCGIAYLGVATVEEGAELREGGIDAHILLFSQPQRDELDEAVRHSLIPFIGDGEAARLFAEAAERAGCVRRVFLKVDTGMGRMGCRPEEAPALAALIASLPSLEYTGTATHLAVSDCADAESVFYTRTQIQRFEGAVGGIWRKDISPGILSAANSGAVAFARKDTWFDLVRPGILLYGYQPPGISPPVRVLPVMELVTAIAIIKHVKRGESVSYGRTWTAERDTNIAVLPLGYGDGLPRALSGSFTVVIGGKSYPLVGRICMDQCMADIGPYPEVGRFDPVSVFGGADKAALDAAELAARIGTIPYEITCGISKRVPRVYSG